MIPVSLAKLAEQILKGGTLADKLVGHNLAANQVDFTTPWMGDPDQLGRDLPGRVGALNPDDQGLFAEHHATKKNRFPKPSELHEASARGRLLHFFANHELLAIETMALTLLKFPDAPIEFKKGVWKTLQDEQRHLMAYQKRMEELGVNLGDFPLNLYFWNSIKSIQSPFDFVVRMSMTFEQANLDFALENQLAIERVGDEVTSRLLKTVHDDEVAHVKHGLKWFRHWRKAEVPSAQNDFEAYHASLCFPLNARRARGGAFFSVQSRLDAGMDPAFIDEIQVAGGSRGRAPDLYSFNPSIEWESKMPELSKTMQARVDDLEPLLFWFAKESDVLLLQNKADLKWLKTVQQIRGELGEVILKQNQEHDLNKFLAIDQYKPWGWGNQEFILYSKVKHKIRNPNVMDRDWMKLALTKAYWAKEFNLDQNKKMICNAKELIENGLKLFKDHPILLLKESSSASGRGHRMIQRQELDQVAATLKADHDYILEPFLDRVADVSTNAEIKADGSCQYFEPRFFVNDSKFQYRGSYLGSKPQLISNEIMQVFNQVSDQRKKLLESIVSRLKKNNYVGPFGVDHFIYRHRDGDYRVQLFVEVNVRYTMGRIALEIEHALKASLGAKINQAVWKWVTFKEIEAAGFKNFQDYELYLKSKHKQMIPTTPSSTARQLWTVVVVE